MRLLIVFLTVFHTSAAAAWEELHIVGLYHGVEVTDGLRHGPRADVVINRTNRQVTLVLSSYRPLRWHLEASYGTQIARVVLIGQGAHRSEVVLNGVPFDQAEVFEGFRYVSDTGSAEFRAFMQTVPESLGFDRASSFTGLSTAPTERILIDGITPDDTDLAADILAAVVEPDGLPKSLLELIDAVRPEAGLRFSNAGFTLRQSDGTTQLFERPAEIERFNSPAGAAMDQARATLYGSTTAVSGLLYSYAMDTGDWRMIREIGRFGGGPMFFDAVGDRLIILRHSASGQFLNVARFDPVTERLVSVLVDPRDLRPLLDFPPTRPGVRVRLRPLGMEGDLLLVEIGLRQAEHRLYFAIDVLSGAATLVDYRETDDA